MVDPTSEVLYLLGLLYVSRHLNAKFPHLETISKRQNCPIIAVS
jgi:hypothetical protein